MFSLGCLYFEMLLEILCVQSHAIHDPYSRSLGKVHASTATIRNHSGVAEGLRIPRSHVCRLSDFVTQMTQANPEDRPTAADVADGLGSNPCCWLEPEDLAQELGEAARDCTS
jgi:hypothetical protein